MIKQFQMQDVVSFAQLQKHGCALDLVERLTHPRSPLRSALWATVLPANLATTTFILNFSDELETQSGFIQTRSRPGRPEQEIMALGPALTYGNGSHAIWQRLLTHVCVKAGEAGQHRIYARLEQGSDEGQVFKNVGFMAYAEEDVYHLAANRFPKNLTDSLGLRKQKPVDSWSLQHLYAAVTPHVVQVAEGLAQGQWQINGHWLNDRAHRTGFVWEKDGEILAACQIRVGKIGRALTLLVHPDVDDQMKPLLEAGLSLLETNQTGSDKPVYVSLRTYQAGLSHLLADYGFCHLATQVVMVKHTTVRAKDMLSRLLSFEAVVEAKRVAPTPILKSNNEISSLTQSQMVVEKGHPL